MKKILVLLVTVFGVVFSAGQAHALNVLTDFEQNVTFPIGQAASAGTAINLRNGTTSLSALAEVMDYRMFAFSYGGTWVNPDSATPTDTAKMGLKLAWILSHFTNPIPSSAQFLQNVNFGPSIAINLLNTPRVATPFFDFNYVFGGSNTQGTVKAPSPIGPSPTVPVASKLNLFYPVS